MLPLLSVSSSVLLCISTLREDDNHYSRMFQKKKPDGSMLFHTIQISTVCDKCRQSDAPEKCNHKQTEMPRWLSSHKMEMIKNMLSDDPALLLRESMGISVESTSRAFKDAAIDDLVKSDQVFPMLLSHIYVAVDPSGGGDSAFAIASIGIMSNGDTVVRARPDEHSAHPPYRVRVSAQTNPSLWARGPKAHTSAPRRCKTFARAGKGHPHMWARAPATRCASTLHTSGGFLATRVQRTPTPRALCAWP